MELRRAVQEDAAAVADVWLWSRHASVPAIPPPVHTDDDVRDWFATVVVPDRETWLLEDDETGAVVALLVLEPGWVDQLYVDPEHTGRGLGSRLLDLAKGRQPDGLQLWAFQANEGARRFYRGHGFVEEQTIDGHNEEGAPDVRLRWSPAETAGGQHDRGADGPGAPP